jgi:CRP/FNR family cyclic AMP-dependent transcriptional regulator
VFKNELLRILQEAKIFGGLSDDHIEMISTHGRILNVNINDIIIEEGQAGHPLYVIMEGRAEVFLPKKRKGHTKERPTRIKLNRPAQGDCIGEYSLIDYEPASASVVAITPCKVFEISRADFGKIMTSSDNLAGNVYRNMLKVLIKRSRQSDKELDICY